MSDFSAMPLIDQMRDLQKDWSGIRERHLLDGGQIDPMVLLVAAQVSHWIIERAITEIGTITRDRDAALAKLAETNDALDAQRARVLRLRNEIDCRVEHGADSNGHLEVIRDFIMENGNVNI